VVSVTWDQTSAQHNAAPRLPEHGGDQLPDRWDERLPARDGGGCNDKLAAETTRLAAFVVSKKAS